MILLVDERQESEKTYEMVKKALNGEPLMVLGRFNASQAATGDLSKKYRQIAGKEYFTFHQSKGMEADNVMIVGCNYWEEDAVWECVPAKDQDHAMIRAVQNRYQVRNIAVEEERLFYVAMTRAFVRRTGCRLL